jgi:hypothetical protein
LRSALLNIPRRRSRGRSRRRRIISLKGRPELDSVCYIISKCGHPFAIQSIGSGQVEAYDRVDTVLKLKHTVLYAVYTGSPTFADVNTHGNRDF